MLINTGVLNWFGGTYDTDQQPRAPMDPNTFHVRKWCFWWFWISFFDRWFSSLFGQINISTPGLFAHIGCPWGLAFHPGLPCSCPPAWRCHQANTFDLYVLCFSNNLNQGAEEALDDNRARGANCKVNIALFRSQFFHKSILFKSRRSAERKAKRGSYELRGLQNLGYTEHRWKLTVKKIDS